MRQVNMNKRCGPGLLGEIDQTDCLV
jgi:hypothetical protein